MVKVDDGVGDGGGLGEVDFRDHAKLTNWFASFGNLKRASLACRTALRAVPFLIAAEPERFEQLALTAFRSLIVSGVQCFGGQNEQHSIGEEIFRASGRKAFEMSRENPLSNVVWMNLLKGAFGALIAGKHPADGAGAIKDLLHGLENIERNAPHAIGLKSAAQTAIITDAKTVTLTKDSPIWMNSEQRETQSAQKHAFIAELARSQKWRFFHDWYLGMWDGTWTDWDLAHEVAKIDAGLWEAGLDAVAAEIEEIKKATGAQFASARKRPRTGTQKTY